MNKLGTLTALFIGLSAAAFGQETPIAEGESPLTFHSELEKNVFSNEGASLLQRLMSTDASANEDDIADFKLSYEKNLSRFRKKQSRSHDEQQLVKHMFYSLHRKALKRYDQYVSFAQMAATGKYDCLTASTLYAMYLDELQFKFDIVETEYHIYLKVYTADGTVMLESTDPLEGYIISDEAIKQAENSYVAAAGGNFKGIADNRAEKGKVINTSVNFTQLAGLHYYNQAIAAWNNNNILTARALAGKAYHLYPSERIASIHKLFSKGNPDLLARGK